MARIKMPDAAEYVALLRLREVLKYDPRSGEFTWLVRTNSKVPAGSVAGTFGVNGYWRIRHKGRVWFAHRLAWFFCYGYLPDNEIDHIDHNRRNNAVSNLRVCTHSQNHQNRDVLKRRLPGAHWHSKDNVWRSNIKTKGKTKSLGTFPTREAAHRAYIEAKREMHPFWKD